MTLPELFTICVGKNVSDIHLVAGQPPLYRLTRQIFPLENMSVLSSDDILALATPILSEEQKQKLFEKKELDLSYEIPNISRFRVNFFWEKGNLSCAARIIPTQIPSFEAIHLPSVAKELAQLRQGLILVTGPTGCGKSTSLAAIIEYINTTRSARLITLEDPVEFIFTSKKTIIMQRELGRDTLSFAEALKHIVRQDPNIIMVGEMRDLETVALAITMAETGHLVLATLHTMNASQTIDRIIDIFPPHQQTQIRLQLSLALRAIISQQLIPALDGGLVAAREVLINNSAVANLIRENKITQIQSVIQTSLKDGMISMERNVEELFKGGLISKEIFDQVARGLQAA